MEYFPVEEMTVKPDATFPASYWQEKTENFRKSEKWLLLRTRKGVEKENNLKQIITDISWTNGDLYLQKIALAQPFTTSLKPFTESHEKKRELIS